MKLSTVIAPVALLLSCVPTHAVQKLGRVPQVIPVLPQAAAIAAMPVPATLPAVVPMPAAFSQAAEAGKALSESKPGDAGSRATLDRLYINGDASGGPFEPLSGSVGGPFEPLSGSVGGPFEPLSGSVGGPFEPLSGSAGRAPPLELGRRKLEGSYRPPADGAIKVAFFDADSTLRVSISGSVSANGPHDVMLLPWVAAKLAALARDGYLIAIVSNQNGIPRHVSLEDSDAALAYAVELIRREGGQVHHYDFAEKRDDDRKPGVGMALRLEQTLQKRFGPAARIDKSRSLMVGDSAYKSGDTRPDGKPGAHFSNSDRLFAEAYGIAFHEPTDFFGWRQHGIDVFSKAAEVEDFLRKNPKPGKD